MTAFYQELKKHIAAVTGYEYEVEATEYCTCGSYDDPNHVHHLDEVVKITAHDYMNPENDKFILVECASIEDEISFWNVIPCTGFELVTFFSKKGLTKAQILTKITLEVDRRLRA